MAKNIKKRVEKVETTEDGKFFTATILFWEHLGVMFKT